MKELYHVFSLQASDFKQVTSIFLYFTFFTIGMKFNANAKPLCVEYIFQMVPACIGYFYPNSTACKFIILLLQFQLIIELFARAQRHFYRKKMMRRLNPSGLLSELQCLFLTTILLTLAMTSPRQVPLRVLARSSR